MLMLLFLLLASFKSMFVLEEVVEQSKRDSILNWN